MLGYPMPAESEYRGGCDEIPVRDPTTANSATSTATAVTVTSARPRRPLPPPSGDKVAEQRVGIEPSQNRPGEQTDCEEWKDRRYAEVICRPAGSDRRDHELGHLYYGIVHSPTPLSRS
jgi:hypothetical protein